MNWESDRPLHARARLAGAALAGTLLALAPGCSSRPTLNAFADPQNAADTLVAHLRTGDIDGLKPYLGDDIASTLSSGDDTADDMRREEFVAAYDRKHDIVIYDDRTAVIVVGENDWPMPIPLVASGDPEVWRFDPERGRDEIIARRIGRNELDAIETCRAVVDAQREYFALTGAYAPKFLSDAGQRNGLYWPTGPGEPQSPLGPLVAEAALEGYTRRDPASSAPRPYRGYCYRMLTAQGPSAPGGERSHLVGDRLQNGFAVVAYPVNYSHSGVMTFITCHHGVVYERDLGAATADLAGAMLTFDPDPRWNAVVDADASP